MPPVPRSRRIRFEPVLLTVLLGVGPGLAATRGGSVRRAAMRDSKAAERLLSRAEICEAIRGSLTRQGIPAAESLRPEDLRIQLAVEVSRSDAALQVKRMAIDTLRRETRFQLGMTRDAGRPPFEVAVPWDSLREEGGERGVPARAGAEARVPREWQAAGSAPGSVPANVAQVGVALVRVGHPATLVMSRENLRVVMTVMPLEAGRRGQRIRVRDPANARILTAEVAAEGLLRRSL